MPLLTASAGLTRHDLLPYAGLSLVRGSVLRIEDGQEMLVAARAGCVWLTQEHERRDILLEAGQRFRLTRGGRTVITALRESVVALASPYARRAARRIDLRFPGEVRALPIYEASRGLRGRMADLAARLMEAWLGLYARPARRARQYL